VGEGTAVGLLFAFGNLFGFVLGTYCSDSGSLMSVIVNGGKSKMNTVGGLVLSLGMFLVGLVLIIFMKEEKNREIHEHNSFLERRSLISSLGNSAISDNKDYISTENPIALASSDNP